MKNTFVAVAVFTASTFFASAIDIPQGAVHQDDWGNAIVVNQCSDSVYYVLDNEPTKGTIEPSSTFHVPVYTKAADGGGGSIKMFLEKDMDLYAKPAKACTQFEFTPSHEQQQVFVDVSNVNSNNGEGKNGNGEDCEDYPPFMKGGLKFVVPGLEDIVCPPGQNPCKTVYSKNNDDFATVATKVGHDVRLVLCPNGGSFEGSTHAGSQNSNSQNQPQEQASSSQPQPSSVKDDANSKPKPSQTEEDEEVVTVAHYVQAPAETIIRYVYADAEAAKEKRQEHVHQHIHNKIHKRRHGA